MNPIDRLFALVAPHYCLGCHREGAILCHECSDAIDTLPSICYACGKATRANRPCADCVRNNRPRYVWIVTKFDDIAKQLVHAYKFEEVRSAAIVIARSIDDILPYFAHEPLVAFVPTASSHRRQRGFDHAELIAREVSRLRKWHYARLLHRNSQARQLGATRKQRKEQLKGVFTPTNEQLIAGKHILLVDDVITTGATIEECTKVLYKAGAATVSVAVFARTPEKKL